MELLKGRIRDSRCARAAADALVALGAGLLASTAFPPIGWPLAAFAGSAVLARILGRRPRFASGWLFGVGLLAPQLSWLSNFHPLAAWPVVMLSALPYGFASRVAVPPLRFAGAMTAAEMFRSLGALALPWGVMGTLAADTNVARLAAWVGVSGLSFLFFLCAALAVGGIRNLVAAASIGLIAGFGCAHLPVLKGGERVTVGVVQASISPERDYEFQPRHVTEALVQGTEELAARGADIVVWSETVILEYLNRPSFARDRIDKLARRLGVTIVCGAPTIVTEEDKRNSAYVFYPAPFDAGGASRLSPGRYDKVHLVPFGEYLPGRGPDLRHMLLPEGVGDFSPAPHVLPVGRLGPLICYEGVMPDLARRSVLGGAGLIVNLSNDAWAKSRQESEQHHALTLLRAAEIGRPFVRAGNVGPSAIVGADGRVRAEIPAGTAAVVLAEVDISEERTLFTRWGDWVGWLALWGLPFSLTAASLVAEDRRTNG
jgi:apolipoprotein N-acyltransferase